MGRASREKGERRKNLPPPGQQTGLPARPLAALFILCLLAVLIYSNTFSVPFILDDADNIVNHSKIRDLANFLDLSGTRFIGFLTFALNYAAGGLNVFGYHLVNLMIHVANGFLVYLLVLLLVRSVSLSKSSWVALGTALLFISHPIQTQAVTYVVQRFASLVTLFYLLAVVCYLKWRLASPDARGRYLWYGAALFSTILAMKTKENSFTLPFMILLVEGLFFRGRRWGALLPFLLTLSIIPLSRGNALGEAEGFTRDTAGISRLDYLFTQFRVIVTYLRLLILPTNQNLDYDYSVFHSLLAPPVFVSFLFLLGLFIMAVRLIGRTGHIRLISFGILWFFLALSVESSILPIRDVIFEHRVYLPSAGFFLGIGLLAFRGWERWPKARVPLAATALLILGTLSVATWRRNLVWGDSVTLWQDVVKKSPGKARGHGNLGSALESQGRIEEAVREYQTALRLQPDYFQARNNLGSAFAAQGRIDEAVREFQAALTIRPDSPEARYNLGNAFQRQGRSEEAVREFQAALDLKPDYAKARTDLGTVYVRVGRLQEAVQEYETAIKFQPDYAEAHNNLGNVYLLQGRLDEAVERYRQALRLKPDFTEARNNLEIASRGRK